MSFGTEDVGVDIFEIGHQGSQFVPGWFVPVCFDALGTDESLPNFTEYRPPPDGVQINRYLGVERFDARFGEIEIGVTLEFLALADVDEFQTEPSQVLAKFRREVDLVAEFRLDPSSELRGFLALGCGHCFSRVTLPSDL
jgi:hypothetical protein